MAEAQELNKLIKFVAMDEIAAKALKKRFGLSSAEVYDLISSDESAEIDGESLTDFLTDLLQNEARLYRRFTARGDYGKYHIDIRGLGGIYFYSAPEFGVTGYFDSIDDADDAVTSEWSDSLTSYNARQYREDFLNLKLIEEKNSSKEKQTKSQVDQSGQTQVASGSLSKSRADTSKKVLGFYWESGSNQIHSLFRNGLDTKSDIIDFMCIAFGSSKSNVLFALTKAEEFEWHDAVRVLNVVLSSKQRVSSLEEDIQALKRAYTMEIEVDDWLRKNEISDPTIEDFVKMAASLKRFFHYREGSLAWDLGMPKTYQSAYERLKDKRKMIEAEHSRPEEQ